VSIGMVVLGADHKIHGSFDIAKGGLHLLLRVRVQLLRFVQLQSHRGLASVCLM
jgi:hypothetical protein